MEAMPDIFRGMEETGVKPLCKAASCTYLTTCRGGLGRNLGAEYVHELCDVLFGNKEFCQVSAEGLDIEGADVDHIMTQEEMQICNLVCGQHKTEGVLDDRMKNGGETK